MVALYFLGGLFPGTLGVARADTTCTITPADLDQVTSAAALGLTAELTVRKALLTKTLSCAKSDAQALQDQLNTISTSDNAKTLQSQLAGQLGDAMNYYDLELVKVGDAGIAGTKGIAKDTLAWRAGTYDPLEKQVANFTLWAENQNLFGVAANRLTQIRNIVSFITHAAPNDDLQNAFTNAETLMQSANQENQAAKDALLRSAPSDQSFALIKQSLSSLSDAYKKFSDANTIIQTLLPASQIPPRS